jgi:hypothetical protein
MSWTIAAGIDNGDPVVISTNDDYLEPQSRAGRPTLVSICFQGPFMLTSMENRDKFEKSLEGFLRIHGGVIVARVARRGAYSFHFQCTSQSLASDMIPIPDGLHSSCTINVHDDPEWSEYQSWLADEQLGKTLEKGSALMQELDPPAEVLTDPEALELLRAWLSKDQLVVTLQSVEFPNGAIAYGMLLADVARHVTEMLHQRFGYPKASTLTEICRVFIDEMKSDAHIAGGFVEPTNAPSREPS